MTLAEGTRSYPETVRLGSAEVTLRYMTAADADGILAFARALPEHDLLFLRRDITDPAAVADWVRDLESGDSVTVLGETKGQVVGYGTIHRNKVGWSSHVAELRVLVAESMRGKGLGRVLTQEAFAIALSRGIEKMVAQMTLDQKGAIATFQGIGFRPEALLRDQVKDRSGKKHDLLVLSHEVAAFESALNAYGVTRAFD
ncbi:MAG: GNAT family N-acetyltransferase [Dehalococcoidia bacterium]